MNENAPILLPDEAHIWTALVPATLPPEMPATLSADERNHARRFHFAKDRLRYVFAHEVLRDVLSRYLDCRPGEIRFVRNAFGKPSLDRTTGSRAPAFNLSHAGDVILVGVCDGRRIGIDVEEIRPIDEALSIAKSHYTPQECAFIQAQPPAGRGHAFFRCWTRKEAYVKAVGKGLSIPLNSFDTLELPESGPLAEIGFGSLSGPPLRIADLNIPEGYVASVAVEQSIDRFVYFGWR